MDGVEGESSYTVSNNFFNNSIIAKLPNSNNKNFSQFDILETMIERIED